MIDVPIDSPCCVVLTDSRIRNTGVTSDKYKTNSSERSHSNICARYKHIFLTGTISILLIILFMMITNLTFSIIYRRHDANNASVRIQPETRLERVIRLLLPLDRRSLLKSQVGRVIDEDPSFGDQTELTSQITQVAEEDVFPTINGKDASNRFKREIFRRRRDCDMSAKHCEKLLQTVQGYLMSLNKQFPSTNGKKGTDILKCLECKKMQMNEDTNKNDEDYAPRLQDQYFSHDYTKQNRSSDFNNTSIKLLDDRKSKNGSERTEVNRTEEAKIQMMEAYTNPLQDARNPSLMDTSILETSTASIDHTDSNGSQRIHITDADSNNSGINDKQSECKLAANDSHVMKNDESVTAVSKIDQHRVINESKDVTYEKPCFPTKSSSTTAQYSVITGDDEQSKKTTVVDDLVGTIETTTFVDLTESITENILITSVPARYDVTGIDGGTESPSARPSFERHPENRSTVENESMENHQLQEDNSKPVLVTVDTTKSIQQSQLTPTMWTMQPICFFGHLDRSNMPLSWSAASQFYPDPPSAQDPLQQGSSSPSNMQVQANTMQFLPRFNYDDSLTQSRQGIGPASVRIGPAGPAISNAPIFPLNQQLTATSQQPIANMSYFCGYMSLPMLGTSQSDRSADEAKDLPQESRKLLQQDGVITQQANARNPMFNKCPINYRQCDNLYCIPRVKWCDGRVDCTDVSDEKRCSCRDRISRDRLCDGYFDCPHGEDELGCFGCPMDSFSCDDWDRRYNSDNCVSLLQRCDGIKQCPNGKDELDCNILLEYMGPSDIFTVGYTEGYLHKNVRGQWYPVCSKALSWAADACESEIGRPLTIMPEIQTVHVPEETFQDLYVTESDNNDIEMTSCPGTAVFVKCPLLPCGIKVLPRQNFFPAFNTTKNNYMSRRYAEEQSVSEVAEFNKFYQETLGLLSANQLVSEEKVQQEQNDTLVGSQSRVVGGRASRPTAWPFLVAIYKDGNFHCGGIILSKVHILTAGHCMNGYEGHYYEIQAGVIRRLSFSPMTQWRKAKYVIIHPDYIRQNMQNDITVIMLDKPLLFNRWVRQVCLPASDTAGPEWKKSPSPQSICVAIGWGAVKESGPDPDHLREVEVPILPSCKYPVDQNNATICAGYPEGGHDACQGDSGGPLMCKNPSLESQWYAAGIISHGDGCGRPNEPGVYMKVSYYVDWILQMFEIFNNQSEYLHRNKPLDSCPGFTCQWSLGRCFPKEIRCDGIVNCLDAEDEIGCEISKTISATYRDTSNTPIKPQEDKVSNDTTEKKKESTETISTPTSSFNFYQTYNNENSNTMDVYATTPEMTTSSVRSTFTCRNLIQTIAINKRCDKHLDCEDGTDEDNCTCRDYLLNLQPMAICDGQPDCDDKTDEKDCDICKNDEFHCSQSGDCIPMMKRCDGNFDCSLREDEVDCFALTNGEYINMDSNNRSVLNTEGLLSRYYNETWRVECPQEDILENSTVTLTIGRNLCKYLGFVSLLSLDKIVVKNTLLNTKFSRFNTTDYEPSPKHVMVSEREEGETCTTLRFRCKPVLSSSADSYLVVDPRTGNRTYLWPWLAAIFVDGRYHCSALLLEPDWLLSSSSCTEAIRLSVNYTTALLGQSRSFLYVDGPYQQISVVDEIRNVIGEVSLLHLKTAVNFTRYVQPLFLEKKIYPPAKDDLCVAIGTNNEHVTQSIFLRPSLEHCDKCYRCFVETSSKCPANGTSSEWSGTVVCRSEKGWYPAAVFQENTGPCSFRSARNLTSIDNIHAHLMQVLEKVPQPTSEAKCDGVRCNIGQCIPEDQVCDGVMNCRDGEDEKSKMCLRVQQTRRRNGNRKCAKSELRCRNNECVSKSAFCDGKVDCSDGTDEPIRCSCAEYLKLTTPERLCDGVRHCLDKTDESPEMCQCTEASFKCNTGSKNLTCISQDFVCDGDNDCPNGEDETDCKKVQKLADDRFAAGEVVQRSYGVWHSLCYPSVMSQEEAANVCRENDHANGIVDYKYQICNQAVVPSRDNFYMVRLNNLDTWITMRDDKPLITLIRPEKPCYCLHVKCN